MCSYSMIANDWMNPNSPNYTPVPGWPQKQQNPFDGILPVTITTTPPVVTPDIAKQMLEILQRLDALDKKLGRLDCILNEVEKTNYVNALRKIADVGCDCGEPHKKKKAKKKKARRQLLNE